MAVHPHPDLILPTGWIFVKYPTNKGFPLLLGKLRFPIKLPKTDTTDKITVREFLFLV